MSIETVQRKKFSSLFTLLVGRWVLAEACMYVLYAHWSPVIGRRCACNVMKRAHPLEDISVGTYQLPTSMTREFLQCGTA